MKNEFAMVIFTDLDGTLLDHETYSFAAAREALETLVREHVPLILCSSKTRAEVELLQQELRLSHPFISENGGALYVPKGYFPFSMKGARAIAGYDVVEFGVPYFRLVEKLHHVAGDLGVPVMGFSDLTVEEVARECGLSVLEARLAKLREYDEPFRILDSSPATQSRLLDRLHRAGFRVTHGGRFHHVTGVADKGHAVRTLRSCYAHAWGKVLAVGLGDSLNDLPMLQAVDVPVVVQNPATEASARLLRKVPRARLTTQPGPQGWSLAILALLGNRLREPAYSA